MLQLIPYALAAVAGGWLGKKYYPLITQFDEILQPNASVPSIQLLRESIVEERPVVLATEEVPLDNRFGNQVLVSEHEFIRTATISLTMSRDLVTTSGLKASWWPILENMAQEEIKKTHGIELNTQITRRVKVVFSTEPGHLVRYRVIWKQDSRRGLLEVDVEGGLYSVPYIVTFGLSHAIESMAGEVPGVGKGLAPKAMDHSVG
ncbi:conserved hypothetical protein, conserved protein of unknown function with homology of Mmc1_2245 and Mmc1_3316 of Magnetococcus marinus MC-1 and SS-5 [Gammaproteobacteria bacterium]